MDKRLPIALLLSVAILTGWQLLNPPRPRPAAAPAHAGEQAPSRTVVEAPGGAEAARQGTLVDAAIEDTEERTTSFVCGRPGDLGYFRATFSNRGGTLVELRSGNAYRRAGLDAAEKADPENWVDLIAPIRTEAGATRSMSLSAESSAEVLQREPIENALWRMETIPAADDPDRAAGIAFEYAPGTGVTFRKRFLFDAARQGFEIEIAIANEVDALAGERQFVLVPAAGMPANSGDVWWRGREPQAIAAGRPAPDRETEAHAVQPRGDDPTGSIPYAGELRFAGVQNKYFAVLVRAASDREQRSLIGATYRRLTDAEQALAHGPDAAHQVVADVHLKLDVPRAGSEQTYRYAVYAGPKDDHRLVADAPEYRALIDADLGFFAPISNVLVWVLRFFERISGNWGVAIILLTVTVRCILFPVNRRSQTSMARYQAKVKRLQPKIEEIKQRFKSDVQRQRQEQAKLMQAEGAFPPLGGCLPIFLQIPVFFGLYRALGVSYDLRQVPFFAWIHDLSLPDRLLRLDLNTHLPLIGTIEYLNILPLLMVVLWIWQQKGMPMPADEQAARMQKMMMWMPVMMGFFLYNYAAGLSLYMITQSGLGIFEQKVIKKFWPVDDTEQPKKGPGLLARLAQAQEREVRRLQGKRPKTQGGH